MPSLSVGLPVYNGAKWIDEAIASILEQSFADFELVIVDNASTDGTEAICRAAAERDGRIRYHRNPGNIGALRNYGRAFELSIGKYFKWASCSDICLDGFFEKCIAVLDARPDVVLAYPRAIFLYELAGGEEQAAEYDDDLNLEQERPSDRFSEYLNRERFNNVMNGVMRASALRQTALILPLPGSDISMIAELTLRGKFVELPDRLFVRRFGAQTTGILMSARSSSATAQGYPGQPTLLQRVKLHSYRFVTAGRAPIGLDEKIRVWRYLLRRVAWLRHQVWRRIAGIANRARWTP